MEGGRGGKWRGRTVNEARVGLRRARVRVRVSGGGGNGGGSRDKGACHYFEIFALYS